MLEPWYSTKSLGSIYEVQKAPRFANIATRTPRKLQDAHEPLARLSLSCLSQRNLKYAIVFVVESTVYWTLLVVAKVCHKVRNCM